MVKELIHDPIRLAMKSAPATKDDLPAAKDLADTLAAHRERCVGMAANMIGVQRRIIVVAVGDGCETMFNPEILKKAEPYRTREGCLSLLGEPREVTRYNKIKVRWQTADFSVRIKSFSGFPAEIIQHEIDHCDGILI